MEEGRIEGGKVAVGSSEGGTGLETKVLYWLEKAADVFVRIVVSLPVDPTIRLSHRRSPQPSTGSGAHDDLEVVFQRGIQHLAPFADAFRRAGESVGTFVPDFLIIDSETQAMGEPDGFQRGNGLHHSLGTAESPHHNGHAIRQRTRGDDKGDLCAGMVTTLATAPSGNRYQ